MTSSTIVPGVYEHYKGKKYFVLGLTRHSESGEICVVYRPLYDSDWPHLWHRPLAMFCEDVVVDGESRPRFKLISA
jgi:hypothetical protein